MPDPSPPVLPDAILPADGQEGRADLPSRTGGLPELPQAEAEAPDAATSQAGPGIRPQAELVPGVQSLSHTTSTPKSRSLALIAKCDETIRRRNTSIVATASLGPAYDPAGPKPDHLSERQWRIIKASWANMKAAPTWLTMAYRITESYKKAEADNAKPQIVINAEKIEVAQQFNYPVRDLDE